MCLEEWRSGRRRCTAGGSEVEKPQTTTRECGAKDAVGKYESAEAVIQCWSGENSKSAGIVGVDNVSSVVVSNYDLSLSLSLPLSRSVGDRESVERKRERPGRHFGAFL